MNVPILTFTELAAVYPRQDLPAIHFGKLPGKNLCLTFSLHNVRKPGVLYPAAFNRVLHLVVAWIGFHHRTTTSPLHEDIRASQHFVQSQSDNYLMLEFWGKDEDAYRAVSLLRGRFEFNFQLMEGSKTPT